MTTPEREEESLLERLRESVAKRREMYGDDIGITWRETEWFLAIIAARDSEIERLREALRLVIGKAEGRLLSGVGSRPVPLYNLLGEIESIARDALLHEGEKK